MCRTRLVQGWRVLRSDHPNRSKQGEALVRIAGVNDLVVSNGRRDAAFQAQTFLRIHALNVASKHRGRGVGTSLLRSCVALGSELSVFGCLGNFTSCAAQTIGDFFYTQSPNHRNRVKYRNIRRFPLFLLSFEPRFAGSIRHDLLRKKPGLLSVQTLAAERLGFESINEVLYVDLGLRAAEGAIHEDRDSGAHSITCMFLPITSMGA